MLSMEIYKGKTEEMCNLICLAGLQYLPLSPEDNMQNELIKYKKATCRSDSNI